VDKTPEAARQLISNMAVNSKQFGTRGDFANKRVIEVSISNLENKVNDLTSLLHSLACGNVQQVKVCNICSLQEHTSDMCPTMQEVILNKLMQLMEDSTDSPSVNMIHFPTRTILDTEIIPTYVMGTHLNKAIKADD